MNIEQNIYRVNLENFIAQLRHVYVKSIILNIDMNPEFDLTTIPFHFDYSYNATVLTSNGHFKISTSQNSCGDDTFWIEELEHAVIGDKIINVNSAMSFANVDNLNGYAFKLSIKFDDKEIYIYCGEIYDNSIANKNDLKYVVCDEMLLIFYNERDAVKFEELSNLKIYFQT